MLSCLLTANRHGAGTYTIIYIHTCTHSQNHMHTHQGFCARAFGHVKRGVNEVVQVCRAALDHQQVALVDGQLLVDFFDQGA